jgi:homoserine kinase
VSTAARPVALLSPPKLHLRLPATSANLGPGFDTLALALALYLEIDAELAAQFSIHASGRNTDICSRVEANLLLQVYRDTVRRWSATEAVPLALTMRNGIPLGMGCGSSAASRLAGVALASHFGSLGLTRDQVLAEAARLEGHPDNAAACWLGGFVASGWNESPRALAGEHSQTLAPEPDPTPVAAISIAPPATWHALLVLPAVPLATTASRAILPNQYSRRDTVLNLQRVAVLTAAFAAGRGDLLHAATSDSIHQPYRGAVCPLLPLLLPLAGTSGILSVTLSGAGPAVLLLLDSAEAVPKASTLVQQQVAGYQEAAVAEHIDCRLAVQPAEVFTESYVNG